MSKRVSDDPGAVRAARADGRRGSVHDHRYGSLVLDDLAGTRDRGAARAAGVDEGRRDRRGRHEDAHGEPDGTGVTVHLALQLDQLLLRLGGGAADVVLDVRGGRRCGDRVQQGRTDRAAHLLRGVDHRGGDTGVTRLDTVRGQGEGGHERRTHAEAEQYQPRQDDTGVRGVDLQPGEEEHAGPGDQEARSHQQARGNPGYQAGADLGGAHHQAADQRQEGEAGLDRRVALHELHVVGQEEEQSEQRDDREAEGEVDASAVALGDDAQRQQRGLDLGLGEDERGEQHRRGDEQADRRGVAPAVGLGAGEGVDQRDQAEDGQDDARDVERRAVAAAGRLTDDEVRARGRDDGERDVDEERPAPVHVLGEDAAEDEADGAAATGDRAVDAERLGALLGLCEHHGEQGERGGREQRAERTLQGTGAEHRRLVRGRAAEGGRGGEADQTGDEGALATPEIRDTAAEEQQTTEGQGVRRDDPLAVAVGYAQVLLGGRQRDVHDSRVQNDHQLGERDEGERFPT